MPTFCSAFIFIASCNLSHNFLHKYNPIPVDFFPIILPFSPVNPFSNTLESSYFFIPNPLSFMYKVTFSFCSSAYISIDWFSFLEYLIEF